ncbi:MAG: hypothetical protein WDW36_002896 [Sanguina aurantia]
MAPLPPIWDPSAAIDKLPQPFRLVDKLVAEIVERALEVIAKNDLQRKKVEAAKIDLTFAPHAVLSAAEDILCFCPLGLAGIAVCGSPSGQVLCYSARSQTSTAVSNTHPSAVTALDTAQVVTTSARWAASASATLLVIHEVNVQSCAMRTVASAVIPEDPDPRGVPSTVTFSPNAGHVAVCFSSGSLVVYELPYPERYTGRPMSAGTAAADAAALAAQPPGELTLVLHMPVATIRQVLIGNPVVTHCNIMWQQQQRPDKSGRSDRYHRAARGLYMWWRDCNKLLLTCFDVIAKQVRSSSAEARGLFPHTREWLLPHGITCCASTSDAKLMAFGLMDGTVLVWDDKFGGHVKILPRMTGPVTAVCYVNGSAQKLMCTSSDGAIRMADLVNPEDDTWVATPLPLAVTQIYFVPMLNDPLALLLCQGQGGTKPRMLWYDVAQEKLVGELLGTKDSDFGNAGLPLAAAPAAPAAEPPIPPPPPPAPGTPGGRATASSGSKPSTAATAVAGQGSHASGSGSRAPSGPSAFPSGRPFVTGSTTPEGTLASTARNLSSIPFPSFSIKDSYLVAGGHIVERRKKSNFDDDVQVTRTAQLYMYKVDALTRHLLPDEDQASKGMLERLLADLESPRESKKDGRRVRMDVPDPSAPVLSSSLRKSESAGEGLWGAGAATRLRRHIAFTEGDTGAFDDEAPGKAFPKETKVFPKESRKGEDKVGACGGRAADPSCPPLSLDKLQLGRDTPAAADRPASPPWHHTNPLARIHPDWEEAPVLARVMDRIGHKGGGPQEA